MSNPDWESITRLYLTFKELKPFRAGQEAENKKLISYL